MGKYRDQGLGIKKGKNTHEGVTQNQVKTYDQIDIEIRKKEKGN